MADPTQLAQGAPTSDKALMQETVDLWKTSLSEHEAEKKRAAENSVKSAAVKRADELRALGFPSREDVERFLTNKLESINQRESKIQEIESQLKQREDEVKNALADIQILRERFNAPQSSGALDDNLARKEEPNPLLKFAKLK